MPYADPTAQRQANTAAQRRRRARHRAQVVDATEAASPAAPDALAAATVPSDVPGLCEATLRQAAVFIANPDSPQSLAAALRAATLAYSSARRLQNPCRTPSQTSWPVPPPNSSTG